MGGQDCQPIKQESRLIVRYKGQVLRLISGELRIRPQGLYCVLSTRFDAGYPLTRRSSDDTRQYTAQRFGGTRMGVVIDFLPCSPSKMASRSPGPGMQAPKPWLLKNHLVRLMTI